MFNNEDIMKELFNAIKDVDNKFSKLNDSQKAKQLNKLDSIDMLSKFESQSKANMSQQNKNLRMELDVQREFEESLATRKSCLQIIVIIVEFLNNAIIKNG